MVEVRIYLKDKNGEHPLDVELVELPKVSTNIYHSSRSTNKLKATSGEYKVNQVIPCINVDETGKATVHYLVNCTLDKADC